MNQKTRLALSNYVLSIILILSLVVSQTAMAAEATSDPNITEHLVGGLNLGIDDSKGKEARALFLVNPDTEEVWNFPLTDIPGGPIVFLLWV